MHKHTKIGHLVTVISIGFMLVVFVAQATIRLQQQDEPKFSLEYRNIAYGYHTSSNLCQDHTPNGSVQSPEECDDSNSSNLDACTNLCKDAECGDGYVRSGTEICDDGNTSSGDGCSASCSTESGYSCTGTAPSSCATVCGNGIKTSDEACDDGNTSSGDGCSSMCAVESGFSCTGTAPTACATVCGDGIVAGAEQCDDMNSSEEDACLNSCISNDPTCGDGFVQDGEACDGNGSGTGGETSVCDVDCTAVSCGDLRVNASAGEQCDDGNSANTDACVQGCRLAVCGDGYLRSGQEQCEPPGIGTCSASCSEQRGVGASGGASTPVAAPPIKRIEPSPYCGNGIVDADKGEKCDVGRFNGLSPFCDRLCNNTFCGNGIVEPGAEECEPGRQEDGDFAVRMCGGKSCTVPVCDANGVCVGGCMWAFTPMCKTVPLLPVGSGSAVFPFPSSASPALELPSSSNDGLHNAANSGSLSSAQQESSSSSSTSSFPGAVPADICGDGKKNAGEECDNGQQNSNTAPDSCRVSCRLAFCGDGVVDAREACDDANDILGDGCTPLCTLSMCGNGVLEHGEECDEGILNADGSPDTCSTRCLLPRCGDGVADISFGEACDNGSANSNSAPDACRLNCALPRCGDGVKDASEQCDDGNAASMDFCTTSCRAVICGNGTVDWNEACDDGNTNNGDGCSNSCLQESTTFLDWLKNSVRLPFSN